MCVPASNDHGTLFFANTGSILSPRHTSNCIVIASEVHSADVGLLVGTSGRWLSDVASKEGGVIREEC